MKKMLSSMLLMALFTVQSSAIAEINVSEYVKNKEKQPIIEQLANSKGEVKTVRIFDNKIVLTKGNIVEIAFAHDFTSKDVKIGDKVNFVIKDKLQTESGKLILPAGTQIISTAKEYYPPKSFNRNAKLYLEMGELLLPNGQTGTISAQVNTKDGMLKRSGWNIFAKISEWTIGLLGVGAGMGAAIGAGASAAGVGCLAIGLPIGAGLGLIIGTVTPGINYRVKAGKEIKIVLTEDLDIILNEDI